MNNQYSQAPQATLGSAGQQLRRDTPASTLEELCERLGSVNNRLEGLRNSLYAKIEKLQGEQPMKEDVKTRPGPDVPVPMMAGGLLGNIEMRIRSAAQTLDQLEAMMQGLNTRI